MPFVVYRIAQKAPSVIKPLVSYCLEKAPGLFHGHHRRTRCAFFCGTSCGNLRVALGQENMQHVLVRLHLAGHDLGEDARRAAGDQRAALLVHADRLLLVTGLDVPEHDLWQAVAMGLIEPLCLLEV